MELIDVKAQRPRYFTAIPKRMKGTWWTPFPEVMDSYYQNRASAAEPLREAELPSQFSSNGELLGFYRGSDL